MDFNNKVLKIGSNEYLVIKYIKYEGKDYLYLSNKTDEKDVIIREVVMRNNDMYIQDIIDKSLRDKVYDLFIKSFVGE